MFDLALADSGLHDEACNMINLLTFPGGKIKRTEERHRGFSAAGTYCINSGHASTLTAPLGVSRSGGRLDKPLGLEFDKVFSIVFCCQLEYVILKSCLTGSHVLDKERMIIIGQVNPLTFGGSRRAWVKRAIDGMLAIFPIAKVFIQLENDISRPNIKKTLMNELMRWEKRFD
jgi:hypothetical protein